MNTTQFAKQALRFLWVPAFFLCATLQAADSPRPGSVDGSFVPPEINGEVRALLLQPDGKVLIAGTFTNVGPGIARLNADGQLDATFNAGSGILGQERYIAALALQSDGKILIGGSFDHVDGTERHYIARLNADGSLDSSFDPAPGPSARHVEDNSPDVAYVASLAVQPDGKIVLGGHFTDYGTAPRNSAARLLPNGALDEPFNPDLFLYVCQNCSTIPIVRQVAIQPDGKLLFAGYIGAFNVPGTETVLRYNPDGTKDTNFVPSVPASPYVPFPGSGGILAGTTDWNVTASILHPDGRITLATTLATQATYYPIYRLTPNGSVDPLFYPPAGPPTLPGQLQAFEADAMALQPDGKIVVGGSFTNLDGVARTNLVRLTVNGQVDLLFDPGSGTDGKVQAMALQPDGKIVIAGAFASVDGVTRTRVARLFGDDFTPRAPEVRFQPPSRTLFAGTNIIFNAFATGFPLNYQWFLNHQPISGQTNSSLILTNVSDANEGVYTVQVKNDQGETMSDDAVLEVRSLADALDTPGWTWTTTGGYGAVGVWQWQGEVTHDGVDAAQSPPMMDDFVVTGFAPWLETTVTGPGTLQFFSKNNFANSSPAHLTLSVDGTDVMALTESHDWEQDSYDLPPGVHTVRWTAQKACCGQNVWLDQVTLVPVAAAPPIIEVQPVSQNIPVNLLDSSFTLTCVASGKLPLTFQWFKDGNPIPGATNATFGAMPVSLQDRGQYTVTVKNSDGEATSLPAFIYSFDLGTVLESPPDIRWIVNFPGLVDAVTNITHSTSEALQLNRIRPDAFIDAQMKGPGVMSFWYKVSADLQVSAFHPDTGTVRLLTTSGKTDWQQLTIYISDDRTYELEFSFSSGDNSVPTGTEAAWIDDVKFTPAQSFPLTLGAPELNSQGVRLQLNGAAVSQNYVLESSTNLTQWAAVTNFIGKTMTTEITAPGLDASRRFYRVRNGQ